MGAFTADAKCANASMGYPVSFLVSEIPDLNLLVHDAIRAMRISLELLYPEAIYREAVHHLLPIWRPVRVDRRLQLACRDLCNEFGGLFNPELGCLRGVQLAVEFEPEARPTFCKPRSVPFAMQGELAQAYDAGIARGALTPTSFNDWGIPVVPVRSVAVFQQTCLTRFVVTTLQLSTCNWKRIDTRCHFLKKWCKDWGWLWLHQDWPGRRIQPGQVRSEKPWKACAEHYRGVLLQNVLPFGISSASGYFQQVMDEITGDFPGVAVYLDDILCSGATAEAHLQNLRRLLESWQRTTMPAWEMHLRPATSGLLGARAVQRRNSPGSRSQCPQQDASAAWRVHNTFVSRLLAILRQVFAIQFCFGARTAIPSHQES